MRASGSGTNAENIINHFEKSEYVQVKYIVTNKNTAGVIKRAERLKIPVKIILKKELISENFLEFLKEEADFIVLAGFLLKIPENIISMYSNRIVNIHPALLPKYGGKGMYGMHVHQAVVDNKESRSGITIHYVNEKYDEGNIIFQKEIQVLKDDKADDVAAKIHQLEQENFPNVIEQILTNNL
jgi:phosphoribosylglycinamide formyltransferase-1